MNDDFLDSVFLLLHFESCTTKLLITIFFNKKIFNTPPDIQRNQHFNGVPIYVNEA